MTILAIYYATETGNSESLARRAYERAQNQGLPARLHNLSEVKPGDLADTGSALFIVSTWGDGEPPTDATNFHDELMADDAPGLPALRYAVLGLGDSSYTEFNAFARRLDTRLGELGAQRLMERIEADLQFEEAYEEWERRVFPLLLARA